MYARLKTGAGLRRALAMLAAIPFASMAPAADTPQTVGIAAAVVRDVKIGSGASPRLHSIALRERVALADRIETGQRSQLQILLLDRSTFSIGANARLTIDRFVYDPDRNRDLGVSIARGAFRYMSGRPSARHNATIDLPVGSIGIRGTIVDGVVGGDAQKLAMAEPAVRLAMTQRGQRRGSLGDPQVTSLIVLRGPGLQTEAGLTPGLASVRTGDQDYVLERPAQALYLPGGEAAPVGPFTMSQQGLQGLDDLIQPALAQWRKSASSHGGLGILGGILSVMPAIIDSHEGSTREDEKTHN